MKQGGAFANKRNTKDIRSTQGTLQCENNHHSIFGEMNGPKTKAISLSVVALRWQSS